MKLWKPIVAGLVVGVMMGLAWATMEGDFPPNVKANTVKQERIVLVESHWLKPYLYIVRVDDKEYLVHDKGGIVPLDSKP